MPPLVSHNKPSKPSRRKIAFRVGDVVTLRMAGEKSQSKVRILEDRGPIGVKGRRLFRIQLRRDPQQTFEVPADYLIKSPAHKPS